MSDPSALPTDRLANRLGEETSPYLLQHRDNPVAWQAWGPEAFEIARRSHRPVLLSVGYAACHWCHVMAHESFENPAIAAQMNELFVSIKVDREERPDVDSIYQQAVALLGEQGGWPLTVFLTPDGEPFWGGTYFPPEPRFGRPGFPQVLARLAQVYAEDPDGIAKNVAALTAASRLDFPTFGAPIIPTSASSFNSSVRVSSSPKSPASASRGNRLVGDAKREFPLPPLPPFATTNHSPETLRSAIR